MDEVLFFSVDMSASVAKVYNAAGVSDNRRHSTPLCAGVVQTRCTRTLRGLALVLYRYSISWDSTGSLLMEGKHMMVLLARGNPSSQARSNTYGNDQGRSG